jgi:hypothetical protein
LRTKKVLKDRDIPNNPEQLEECLDHIFDGASVIVKKAIVDQVKEKFGLAQESTSMKETFELARKLFRNP